MAPIFMNGTKMLRDGDCLQKRNGSMLLERMDSSIGQVPIRAEHVCWYEQKGAHPVGLLGSKPLGFFLECQEHEICWDEFDESAYKTRIQQEDITYNPSKRDSDLVRVGVGSFIESKWENTVFDRGTEYDILDQKQHGIATCAKCPSPLKVTHSKS